MAIATMAARLESLGNELEKLGGELKQLVDEFKQITDDCDLMAAGASDRRSRDRSFWTVDGSNRVPSVPITFTTTLVPRRPAVRPPPPVLQIVLPAHGAAIVPHPLSPARRAAPPPPPPPHCPETPYQRCQRLGKHGPTTGFATHGLLASSSCDLWSWSCAFSECLFPSSNNVYYKIRDSGSTGPGGWHLGRCGTKAHKAFTVVCKECMGAIQMELGWAHRDENCVHHFDNQVADFLKLPRMPHPSALAPTHWTQWAPQPGPAGAPGPALAPPGPPPGPPPPGAVALPWSPISTMPAV